jgi:opacity protein-like surface antigen
MLNKKIIIKTVVGVSVLFVANAHAVSNAYIGGQLGYSNVHQANPLSMWTLSSQTVVNKSSNNDTGVAGRIFGGYQVNKYFSAELGLAKFSNATSKLVFNTPGFNYSQKDTIKTNAIDLVAKAILPIKEKVSIYGKLGAAYVIQNDDYNDNYSSTAIPAAQFKGNTNTKQLLPTFGVGASYAFTPNIAADISYNRIQETNNSKINSIDFYSVGLIYSIC